MVHYQIYIIYIYVCVCVCSQKGRKCALPVTTNRENNSCAQGFLSRTMTIHRIEEEGIGSSLFLFFTTHLLVNIQTLQR